MQQAAKSILGLFFTLIFHPLRMPGSSLLALRGLGRAFNKATKWNQVGSVDFNAKKN